MYTTIYFDAPAIISPAVHLAFAPLGGLDLEHPQPNFRRELGFKVKAPRQLTLGEVLEVADAIAQHHGVTATKPVNPDDLSQVAAALSKTADAIAAKFGETTVSESAQEFDPAFANPAILLFGLLHWSFDGNNWTNMEFTG
jgi:hypothetical protein